MCGTFYMDDALVVFKSNPIVVHRNIAKKFINVCICVRVTMLASAEGTLDLRKPTLALPAVKNKGITQIDLWSAK